MKKLCSFREIVRGFMIHSWVIGEWQISGRYKTFKNMVVIMGQKISQFGNSKHWYIKPALTEKSVA